MKPLPARFEWVLAAGLITGAACGLPAHWTGLLLAALLAGTGRLLLDRRYAIVWAAALTLGAGDGYLHGLRLHLPGHYETLLPHRDVYGEARLRLDDSRVTAVPGIPAPGLLRARVTALRLAGETEFRPVHGVIYLRRPDRFQPAPTCGALVTVEGAFERPRPNLLVNGRPAAAGMNFEQYLAARDADRILRADSISEAGRTGGLLALSCRVRDRILERALHGVDSDRVRRAAAALFFGVTGGIGEDMRESFVRSGTIHLFSVSGMHVAILAAVLLRLFAPLPFRVRYPLLAGMVLLYVLTTGANAPAMRAFYMIALWCALRCRLHYTPPLNSLALAAGILVFLSPNLVRDLGFQYSFAITAVLLLLAERFRGWNELFAEAARYMPRGRAFRVERRLRRGSGLLFAIVSASVAFLAGSAISLHSQGLFLPGSVAANIAVSPLVAALYPVLFVKLATGWLWGGFDQAGAWLLETGFQLMEGVTRFTAEFFGPLAAARPGWFGALLFTLGILFLVGAPRKGLSIAGGTLSALLFGFWLFRAGTAPPVLLLGAGGAGRPPSAAVFEPSRGLASAVNVSTSDAADAVTLCARRNGITRLDRVILTRPRTGAAAGLPRLARSLPVTAVELPPFDAHAYHLADLLELRAPELHLIAKPEIYPGFWRILDQKEEIRLDYSNPGSTVHFSLFIRAGDDGWLFTLRQPGRPTREFRAGYGNLLEVMEYELR